MSKVIYPKLKIRFSHRKGCRYAIFQYKLSRDVGFSFSTLAECRDDIADMFRKRLREDKFRWRTVNIDEKPYVITVIEEVPNLDEGWEY
jgi:hypothetical protein